MNVLLSALAWTRRPLCCCTGPCGPSVRSSPVAKYISDSCKPSSGTISSPHNARIGEHRVCWLHFLGSVPKFNALSIIQRRYVDIAEGVLLAVVHEWGFLGHRDVACDGPSHSCLDVRSDMCRGVSRRPARGIVHARLNKNTVPPRRIRACDVYSGD